MESDRKTSPDTPHVYMAQAGSRTRWPLLAVSAGGLLGVAVLIGWSLGKSSAVVAAPSVALASKVEVVHALAAEANAEPAALSNSAGLSVGGTAAVGPIPAPPEPPRPRSGPAGNRDVAQRLPPETTRPQATLPWKRALEKPAEAEVTPASLPWKREPKDLEAVFVERAELPWKRSLQSPDPVRVEMAALPWKLYFGR